MAKKRTDADRRVRQSDRLARVLRVLHLIQGTGPWTARAIARELECSERTVYRDLQTHSAAGVPWYLDDLSQSYRVRDGYRGHLLNISLTPEPESDLFRTSLLGHDGTSGFPSDQLIPNIRVGLWETGYYRRDGQLFATPVRDLVVLVFAPAKGHPLVRRYRDRDRLWAAIPHADRLNCLPRSSFVGELSYSDVVGLIRRQSRWFNRAERVVAADLSDYLEYKLTTAPGRAAHRRPAESTPV